MRKITKINYKFEFLNKQIKTIMQAQTIQLEQILAAFDLPHQEVLGEKYKIDEAKGEDDKKLKKKLKKYQIQETDSMQAASEKVSKMLQEFSKNYETSAKLLNKVAELKKTVDQAQIEKNSSVKQKQMILNLHNGFKTRYNDELKKAQQVEKEQEVKRKQAIEALQQRIKVIQTKYQEAGKNKIQKYRENQTLKHEISRLEPHLIASESLYEAQLKKKAIQIEIQMTTLKQKIQMMDNFKGMKVQTLQKIQNAKIQEEKITSRLKKITDKQDQHKILLAKAHLVFEDYKKALNTLKNILPKKEKEASECRSKALKAQISVKQARKMNADLDLEIQNLTKQKQMLETLENNLRKQLEEFK